MFTISALLQIFHKSISPLELLQSLLQIRNATLSGLTLIKNSLLLISFVLIKPIPLSINTFACLKINQDSTGLFVSYSEENPIAQNNIKWSSLQKNE